MKRDVRSTALALLATGLLAIGSTACSSEAIGSVAENVSAGTETTDAGDASEGASADSQTLTGELAYRAPGEYTIGDQAFYVAESTQILGGIYACPTEDGTDENGSGTVECSFDDFDAALEKGTVVLAEVEIVDGIAESITEYEV